MLCAQCGQAIPPPLWQHPRFCSRKCYFAYQHSRGYTNHNSKLTWDQRDEIIRLYTTPQADGTWLGGTELGRRFGVTNTAIHNILRKGGVTLRDAKESHAHGKRCKPITHLPPAGEPVPNCKCGCGSPVAWRQHKNCWAIYVQGHRHPSRPYQDSEWLKAAYLTERRTMDEIARDCGVTAGSVHRYAVRFGIPVRSRSESRMGRHVGEANGSWKGGTTPERQRLYKAGHWQEFCQTIYARDNFTCRRCGSPKKGPKGLHAHHLKPWAENPGLRFDEANVLTVCRTCHTWIHSAANVEADMLA